MFNLAQARSLTVCPTLWLGRDNNTAADRAEDYTAARVQTLVAEARAAVLRFKDHPALLVWGVGNEMEAPGNGSPELWRAVDQIAAMVHAVDPGHPTMTVIADLGPDGEKVRLIKRHCPHIDILGVNSYGGGPTLARRLAAAGWDKPYLVTEFGADANGLRQTAWGAKIEPPTTQRAAKLAEIYRAAIAPGHPACLGSYVFVWRQSEAVPAFHDCFTPAGERLQHVETMSQAWTGRPVKNRAPRIASVRCAAAAAELAPGDPFLARLKITDPDGDPLRVRWELRGEKPAAKSVRHAGDQLVRSGGAAGTGDSFRVEFPAPGLPGAYRLFITAGDGAGNAAAASVPFYVRSLPPRRSP
ncbi:MAG: hypothetical protein NTZ16_05845 [Verrucomicrobia bacterium]|nr:hypothetical protein [Verrucomicrobiota bacterium]